MDELEKALAEYLRSNFEHGDVVAVRRLRDDVASKYITMKLPLSAALSVVRRFVSAMVEARVLQRVSGGVYTYWPNRDAPAMPVIAFDAPREIAISPFQGVSAPSSFESVETLARSSLFLVQYDLSEVDLDALQGLSF